MGERAEIRGSYRKALGLVPVLANEPVPFCEGTGATTKTGCDKCYS